MTSVTGIRGARRRSPSNQPLSAAQIAPCRGLSSLALPREPHAAPDSGQFPGAHTGQGPAHRAAHTEKLQHALFSERPTVGRVQRRALFRIFFALRVWGTRYAVDRAASALFRDRVHSAGAARRCALKPERPTPARKKRPCSANGRTPSCTSQAPACGANAQTGCRVGLDRALAAQLRAAHLDAIGQLAEHREAAPSRGSSECAGAPPRNASITRCMAGVPATAAPSPVSPSGIARSRPALAPAGPTNTST